MNSKLLIGISFGVVSVMSVIAICKSVKNSRRLTFLENQTEQYRINYCQIEEGNPGRIIVKGFR